MEGILGSDAESVSSSLSGTPEAEENNSDLYRTVSNIIPSMLAKSMLAGGNTSCGWMGGGFVLQGNGSKGLDVQCNPTRVPRTGTLYSAFDLISCSATTDDLKYVYDIRQPPLNNSPVQPLERRAGFPVALAWQLPKNREGTVKGFVHGVYK